MTGLSLPLCVRTSSPIEICSIGFKPVLVTTRLPGQRQFGCLGSCGRNMPVWYSLPTCSAHHSQLRSSAGPAIVKLHLSPDSLAVTSTALLKAPNRSMLSKKSSLSMMPAMVSQ